jgi:hypothetical protein
MIGYVPAVGYDLHITRAEDWSDNQADAITLMEWRALAESGSEPIAEPANGEGFFLVRCSSDDGVDAWFD